MDLLMSFAIGVFVVLVICFTCYCYMTNSIIKDQEKEIAKLRTETMRLQAKLKNKGSAKVIEIHDHRISEENVPTFGDI